MLREHRKRQILEAARQVFARKGYHSTGVADIIAEAKVARGTFYLYFHSKRHVFEVLLDEFLALLQERVRRIDETAGLEGIYRQLRENVTGVLRAFAENPEMARLVLNEAVGLDKGFDEKLSEFYEGLIDLIERSLRLGQEMGIVRPVDTRVIAASVLGAVKEVVQRVLRGRVEAEFNGAERLNAEVEKVVDELLEYNIRGLFVPQLLKVGKFEA